MAASVLVLECATTLYLSTHTTLDAALKEASSRLDSVYDALMEKFPLPETSYTREDYLEFVLKNKLGRSSIFYIRSRF